ncbi:methyltransferase domain-containing protein [Nocardia sp. NPDC046473]|uniref:class I SAM-dependent methyltransferase n=1 Tax=Nocardia sp. NPDC046473 TaxID=3155733 RepID=UPI00340857A5
MESREPQVDWEVLFGGDYEYFDFPELDHELTATEVSTMVELTELKPGMAVLDAPCGHGRHANAFAARGYAVVGVDRDERFLATAKRDAADLGAEVDYRSLDLREMTFQAEFDAAISWYSSFGYFDDETDREILRRYRVALRPGGRFLLDMQSPYRLIPSLRNNYNSHTYVLRRGDDIALDVLELDAVASRFYAERITIRGSAHQRARYCVRMFTAPEILEWFRTAGFAEARVVDETGGDFTVTSRRLRVIGRA